MFNAASRAPLPGLVRLVLWLQWAYQALTRHHQLHQPEHVGMFAGSLLRFGDWEHD